MEMGGWTYDDQVVTFHDQAHGQEHGPEHGFLVLLQRLADGEQLVRCIGLLGLADEVVGSIGVDAEDVLCLLLEWDDDFCVHGEGVWKDKPVE